MGVIQCAGVAGEVEAQRFVTQHSGEFDVGANAVGSRSRVSRIQQPVARRIAAQPLPLWPQFDVAAQFIRFLLEGRDIEALFAAGRM